MRTHIALEMIAAIWLVGAILAKSENLDRIWVVCCAFAFFYGLRAVLNYFMTKEKAIEKDYLISGPGGDAIRVHGRPSRLGNDATGVGFTAGNNRR